MKKVLSEGNTRLAVDIFKIHGTPSSIDFQTILNAHLRSEDIHSLKDYINFHLESNPSYHVDACAQLSLNIKSQMRQVHKSMEKNLPHRTSYERARQSHSFLSLLVGKILPGAQYYKQIYFINILKSANWLVSECQQGTKSYTELEIIRAHECLLDLMIMITKSVPTSEEKFFKKMIVKSLATKHVSYELARTLAILFENLDCIDTPQPPIHTYPNAEPDLPFYHHGSFLLFVGDAKTLEIMETIFIKCGSSETDGIVGLDSEWAPGFAGEETNPSLFQISLEETLEYESGNKALDTYIQSMNNVNKKCRISFLVDLVNLDCELMLNTLFENNTIVKLGFDFRNVKYTF